MSRCEMCGKPATRTCAGLDVPMLGFCEEHAREHEESCPEIRDGRAAMSRPDPPEGATPPDPPDGA